MVAIVILASLMLAGILVPFVVLMTTYHESFLMDAVRDARRILRR